MLCFVFKPRISPAPSTALGARSWLCFESLTHDCLHKGGRVFSELSILVCQDGFPVLGKLCGKERDSQGEMLSVVVQSQSWATTSCLAFGDMPRPCCEIVL